MSLDESKKIGVVFILEAIGKPPEHLKEVLANLAKRIGDEKTVKLIESKVNEPVLMKDQKTLHTSFAEIEMEVEGLMNLIILIFKYMPAHIEITYPEKVSFANDEMNTVLNELTRRMHGYDQVARVIQAEKYALEKKLKSLLEEKGEKKEKKKK